MWIEYVVAFYSDIVGKVDDYGYDLSIPGSRTISQCLPEHCLGIQDVQDVIVIVMILGSYLHNSVCAGELLQFWLE